MDNGVNETAISTWNKLQNMSEFGGVNWQEKSVFYTGDGSEMDDKFIL